MLSRSRLETLARSLVVALAAAGCGDDGPYDPCEDKGCGEECTLCAPDDPDCIETMVLKVCGGDGVCGSGVSCDGEGAGGEDGNGGATSL